MRLKLLSQQTLHDSAVVTSFALTEDGTHIYTAEPHGSLEYAYPRVVSRGRLQPPSGGDLIEGVALTPAEVPSDRRLASSGTPARSAGRNAGSGVESALRTRLGDVRS